MRSLKPDRLLLGQRDCHEASNFVNSSLRRSRRFLAVGISTKVVNETDEGMGTVTALRVAIAPFDHAFGMARIFELEGEATRPNLHVVRFVKEAWAILGVEMEEAKFGPISGAAFAR